MAYLFTFHTVHGVLKARILEWFPIALCSRPLFVRTLQHDPSVLVSLQGMALQFFELDEAVVHVNRLVGFL